MRYECPCGYIYDTAKGDPDNGIAPNTKWEDIPEDARKSILLEEICNILGFNDTVIREDSVVYQYSNDNTELTDVDWLIMELLYHPDIRPGMTMEECHEILAELYQ